MCCSLSEKIQNTRLRGRCPYLPNTMLVGFMPAIFWADVLLANRKMGSLISITSGASKWPSSGDSPLFSRVLQIFRHRNTSYRCCDTKFRPWLMCSSSGTLKRQKLVITTPVTLDTPWLEGRKPPVTCWSTPCQLEAIYSLYGSLETVLRCRWRSSWSVHRHVLLYQAPVPAPALSSRASACCTTVAFLTPPFSVASHVKPVVLLSNLL